MTVPPGVPVPRLPAPPSTSHLSQGWQGRVSPRTMLGRPRLGERRTHDLSVGTSRVLVSCSLPTLLKGPQMLTSYSPSPKFHILLLLFN